MSKMLKISLLTTAAVCLVASSSLATVKFDVSNPMTSITEQIGKVQGTATDTQKQLEHVKTYQKSLDGAKEGMKKWNELNAQAESVKNKVNEAKSEIDEAKSQVNDVKNAAGETMSSATSAVNDATAGAQNLVNVQNEQAAAKSRYENQVKDLESERDAQIKKYQDNNEIIQKTINDNPSQASALQQSLDDNNAKIKEIEQEYQAKIDEATQSYKTADAAFSKQLSSLKATASNVDPLNNVTPDSAKKAISGLFGGDSSAAMNEVIAKNFYAADEADNTKRNGEIMNYRHETALNDSADVYQQAVEVMSDKGENLEYVKSLQSNAQVTETTPAAVTLDLSVKVANMKALLKYAKMLVAEMKMATAQDMIGVSKHLNNYSKDVTAFNIDDYKYKPKKKSLLDSAKDLKNKAQNTVAAAKDTAGKAMGTVGSTIAAATDTVGSVTSSATSAASSVAGSAAGAVSSATGAVGDVAGQASSLTH